MDIFNFYERQFILYAKGWYQSTDNLFNDCKVFVDMYNEKYSKEEEVKYFVWNVANKLNNLEMLDEVPVESMNLRKLLMLVSESFGYKDKLDVGNIVEGVFPFKIRDSLLGIPRLLNYFGIVDNEGMFKSDTKKDLLKENLLEEFLKVIVEDLNIDSEIDKELLEKTAEYILNALNYNNNNEFYNVEGMDELPGIIEDFIDIFTWRSETDGDL